MTAYGYIGLGMMGSAMTQRLASTGRTVHVFDLDSAVVDTAVEQGATAMTSAADVAAASDIVSICVPAASHIEAVLTGDGGIEDGAHEGLRLLIHSTVHPDTVIAAAATAAPWGVKVFDVCVTGGADGARDGELALFVGGIDEMDAETRALLDVFGTKLISGGGIGTGAALKIGVNVMTYMQQAAARIAFRLMDEVGADPAGLVDAWKHTGQLGSLTEKFLTLLSFSPMTCKASCGRSWRARVRSP